MARQTLTPEQKEAKEQRIRDLQMNGPQTKLHKDMTMILNILKDHVVKVTFVKVNGEVREMVCTRNTALIQFFGNLAATSLNKKSTVAEDLTKIDDGRDKAMQLDGGYIKAFDLEKLSFRTFKYGRLVNNPEMIEEYGDAVLGKDAILAAKAVGVKWATYLSEDSYIPKATMKNYLKIFKIVRTLNSQEKFNLKGSPIEQMMFDVFDLGELDRESSTYLALSDTGENIVVNPRFIMNPVEGKFYYSKVGNFPVNDAKLSTCPEDLKGQVEEFIAKAQGKHVRRKEVKFSKVDKRYLQRLAEYMKMERMYAVKAKATSLGVGAEFRVSDLSGEHLMITSKAGLQMVVQSQVIEMAYLNHLTTYARPSGEPILRSMQNATAKFKELGVLPDKVIETLDYIMKRFIRIAKGGALMDDFSEKQLEVIMMLGKESDEKQLVVPVVLKEKGVATRTINSLVERGYLGKAVGDSYDLTLSGYEQYILRKVS